MGIDNYWKDIDLNLTKLKEDGYVKLPSLENFDLELLAENISSEMNGNTFSELSKSHDKFLSALSVDKYLTPKLYQLAKQYFNFKGDISDQYHVARRVEPGNSLEMYRAHFDSHLFTIVFPIKIPKIGSPSGSAGELIYYPNARKSPKNEITNILGKTYHKKFASKEGLDIFSKNHIQMEDNFYDYKPLLFLGNVTLHTNKPVASCCESYRLTLLAHFFDPSPKYGIGSFLRLLRNR